MPKPDNGDQTLPRVGVKSDASNMDTAQLVLAIDDGEGAFMDQLWENCYLFSDWYRRKEWTVGLNSRPRNFHFVQYVQQRFPKRGYTENDLMTRIDCYNTYARVPDAEPAVALIKQMGSLTKAHTAIPWVQRFPGKATEILQVCLSTSAVELRARDGRAANWSGRTASRSGCTAIICAGSEAAKKWLCTSSSTPTPSSWMRVERLRQGRQAGK